MIERVDAVALEGQGLRVTAREPLPVEPRALVVATAVRVFERYPLLRRLTLRAGEGEWSTTREEVDQLLAPQGGFEGVHAPDRWREFVESLVRPPGGERAE